jgi:hypothetical protein
MLFYSLKELRSGCVAQDDSSGPSLSPDGLPSISLSLDSQSLKTHTHTEMALGSNWLDPIKVRSSNAPNLLLFFHQVIDPPSHTLALVAVQFLL